MFSSMVGEAPMLTLRRVRGIYKLNIEVELLLKLMKEALGDMMERVLASSRMGDSARVDYL